MTVAERQDRDARIVSLYLKGEKLDAIGDAVGMSHSRARHRAEAIGLPPRASRRGSQLNMWPLIVAWAKAGFSAEDIAKGINCRCHVSVLRVGSLFDVCRETAGA